MDTLSKMDTLSRFRYGRTYIIVTLYITIITAQTFPVLQIAHLHEL